ncbi:hypothetical protein B0H10DRAFT_1948918 [Mycena sp. CBHHK59/15]|nr:hypothetical protein B0H10DRAFT_1948918 [Mycena sp. CBHHK59/15]
MAISLEPGFTRKQDESIAVGDIGSIRLAWKHICFCKQHNVVQHQQFVELVASQLEHKIMGYIPVHNFNIRSGRGINICSSYIPGCGPCVQILGGIGMTLVAPLGLFPWHQRSSSQAWNPLQHGYMTQRYKKLGGRVCRRPNIAVKSQKTKVWCQDSVLAELGQREVCGQSSRATDYDKADLFARCLTQLIDLAHNTPSDQEVKDTDDGIPSVHLCSDCTLKEILEYPENHEESLENELGFHGEGVWREGSVQELEMAFDGRSQPIHSILQYLPLLSSLLCFYQVLGNCSKKGKLVDKTVNQRSTVKKFGQTRSNRVKDNTAKTFPITIGDVQNISGGDPNPPITVDAANEARSLEEDSSKVPEAAGNAMEPAVKAKSLLASSAIAEACLENPTGSVLWGNILSIWNPSTSTRRPGMESQSVCTEVAAPPRWSLMADNPNESCSNVDNINTPDGILHSRAKENSRGSKDKRLPYGACQVGWGPVEKRNCIWALKIGPGDGRSHTDSQDVLHREYGQSNGLGFP